MSRPWYFTTYVSESENVLSYTLKKKSQFMISYRLIRFNLHAMTINNALQNVRCPLLSVNVVFATVFVNCNGNVAPIYSCPNLWEMFVHERYVCKFLRFLGIW